MFRSRYIYISLLGVPAALAVKAAYLHTREIYVHSAWHDDNQQLQIQVDQQKPFLYFHDCKSHSNVGLSGKWPINF